MNLSEFIRMLPSMSVVCVVVKKIEVLGDNDSMISLCCNLFSDYRAKICN